MNEQVNSHSARRGSDLMLNIDICVTHTHLKGFELPTMVEVAGEEEEMFHFLLKLTFGAVTVAT